MECLGLGNTSAPHGAPMWDQPHLMGTVFSAAPHWLVGEDDEDVKTLLLGSRESREGIAVGIIGVLTQHPQPFRRMREKHFKIGRLVGVICFDH